MVRCYKTISRIKRTSLLILFCLQHHNLFRWRQNIWNISNQISKYGEIWYFDNFSSYEFITIFHCYLN